MRYDESKTDDGTMNTPAKDKEFNRVYEAKFYAQQVSAWMSRCNATSCPMSEPFHIIQTLYEENQRLEYQLKLQKDRPDES